MSEPKLKPSRERIGREPITIRVTDDERKRIAELAEEWTDGNVSEWMRLAALKFKPRKEDFA